MKRSSNSRIWNEARDEDGHVVERVALALVLLDFLADLCGLLPRCPRPR